jgi:hypothetical protein
MIRDDGNVGIGTASPNERLAVIGQGANSTTTAFIVRNSSNLQMLSVRNDGVFFVGQSRWYSYRGSSGEGTPVLSTGLFRLTYSDNGVNSFGYGLSLGNINVANREYTSGDGGIIGTTEGFAPTSGTGSFNGINLPITINQTGGANGVTRGLRIAPTLTNAADWRSIEWTNISGFGLYGSGTADNYLNGNLGIKTTSPTDLIDINGANGYSQLRLRTAYTPTGTADANGNTGDVSWDADYIYIKTAAGWKRSALSTF